MQTQETSGRLFGPNGAALTPKHIARQFDADATSNAIAIPPGGSSVEMLQLTITAGSSSTTVYLQNIYDDANGNQTLTYTLPAGGSVNLGYNPHGVVRGDIGSSIYIQNGLTVNHAEGPSSPGTAASANGDGTLGWVNPNNIKADDTSFATANSSSGTDTTKWILGTNFGFATIPDAATVTRIVVSVKRKAITLADGFVIDLNAQFFITSAAVGGNFALESHWDTTEETVIYDTVTGSVPTEVSTGANVKDATFGFGIEASIASTMSVIAGVQYMTVAVHWNTISGSAVEVCGVYVNRTV